MYTDMYNTFDNENIPYSFPFSFQNNKLDYMQGNSPTYEMSYGDTAIIPFCIDPEYYQHYIHIIIYNYRFEEVYSELHTVDPDGKIRLVINSETSSTVFKKGRYFCRIQAEMRTNISEDVCTLINPEDCVIYVR